MTLRYKAQTATSQGQMQRVRGEVVNVVVTADLGQPVNLMKVSELECFEYDQSKYQGKAAYFKSPSMEGKVTVFGTGKLISVGTRSAEKAEKELKETVAFLAKNGLVREIKMAVSVRNIVMSLDIGHSIDIEGLYPNMPNFVYEPEQFPDAIWRPASVPGATVLLYSNGKLIVLGPVQTERIGRIVEELEHSSAPPSEHVQD